MNISEFKALDYLAVYSYAGIIHIIEKWQGENDQYPFPEL